MNRNYLLIDLDEIELGKKLNLTIFLQEYIVCQNKQYRLLSQGCKCRKKKGISAETRDSIINLILTDNKITLSENELKMLQEMVENRWENLKKLDRTS